MTDNTIWIAPWEDLEAVVIRYIQTYGHTIKISGIAIRRDLKRIIEELEEVNKA